MLVFVKSSFYMSQKNKKNQISISNDSISEEGKTEKKKAKNSSNDSPYKTTRGRMYAGASTGFKA